MQAQPCYSLGNSAISTEVQVLTTDEAPPITFPPKDFPIDQLSEVRGTNTLS